MVVLDFEAVFKSKTPEYFHDESFDNSTMSSTQVLTTSTLRKNCVRAIPEQKASKLEALWVGSLKCDSSRANSDSDNNSDFFISPFKPVHTDVACIVR